ncbi:acetyl-CoA carboxylase biotin carboxyl carrier protein [Primorskyibacter flagellatus]|uniref:acetyl-CoA carboxylase biotin carboxyl carrier protein n=1 Tax=Primorskyibacter flagellatus TaxID=1387277 RepID=UPI003A8FA817
MSITVESLISSMEWAARNDLNEYTYVETGHRITLQRDVPAVQGAVAAIDPVAAHALDLEETAGLVTISAPLGGICHLAEAPDAAPFVTVGAQVTKGQTVCVIEAMKVMSAIVADQDGTVAKICIEDGASVEADATLLKVQP